MTDDHKKAVDEGNELGRRIMDLLQGQRHLSCMLGLSSAVASVIINDHPDPATREECLESFIGQVSENMLDDDGEMFARDHRTGALH